MPAPKPCPHCGTPLVPGVARSSVLCPGCGAEVTLAADPDDPRKKQTPAAPARPAPGGPPIPFQCGRCGQPFQAASQDAGKRSRCPSCGAEIVVPMPAPAPIDAASGPPAELTPAAGLTIRSHWLLVALAVLALPAVWWSWWGLIVPGLLLAGAWRLRRGGGG